MTIRLGSIDIAITEPLDGPWRHLAASPGFDMTVAHPRSRWVFRGYSPGRHIDPASLRNRLNAIFSTRAARLGTLHELTKLAPVAVMAEALGHSPSPFASVPYIVTTVSCSSIRKGCWRGGGAGSEDGYENGKRR